MTDTQLGAFIATSDNYRLLNVVTINRMSHDLARAVVPEFMNLKNLNNEQVAIAQAIANRGGAYALLGRKSSDIGRYPWQLFNSVGVLTNLGPSLIQSINATGSKLFDHAEFRKHMKSSQFKQLFGSDSDWEACSKIDAAQLFELSHKTLSDIPAKCVGKIPTGWELLDEAQAKSIIPFLDNAAFTLFHQGPWEGGHEPTAS